MRLMQLLRKASQSSVAKSLTRQLSSFLFVTVTNTGRRDGDEVVQLYVHHPAAQIARPVKELKGFRRVHLKAGESQRIDFLITPDMLKYKDGNGRDILDAGDYDIMVGPNSSDNVLKKSTLRL